MTPAVPVPPTGPKAARLWFYAGAAVLLVHLLLILLTFRDYGMSWDQPWGHRYQQAIVRFYASGGSDEEAPNHYARHYGGLFDISAALVDRGTGLGWIEARNLTSALFGWIGVLAIMRAGWIAFGPPVGVIAAIFLLLTPIYYGHQFINPKDTPFAAMVMLSLLYIISLALEYPVPRWSTAIKAGLALGGALGVRVGGLILLAPLGLAVVMAFAVGCRRQGIRANIRPGLKLLAQVILIIPLAWTVMSLVWPFAWENPLQQPFVALEEFTKYPWDGNVFYDGKLLKPWELPWSYIPNLLVRTLPEHVLLGLLAGITFVAVLCRRGHPGPMRPAIFSTIILFVAVVLPVAAIWIMRSNLYNGLRHVLFIIPPLVLLAAAGAWQVWRHFDLRSGRLLTGGVFAAALALVLCDMFALHPYEYIYFNRSLAGGLAQANKSYDLDYWGTGLREAARWVVKHYNPTPGKPVLYSYGGVEPEMVEEYLNPDPATGAIFRRAAAGETATLQFLIRRERQNDEPAFGRTLYVVSRQGVPLVDVVEVR